MRKSDSVQGDVEVQKMRFFHDPEYQNGHDEQGVFSYAAGAAQTKGEAFLYEGQQGHAVRGAHVEQYMGEGTETEPSDNGVGQGTELPCERPCPDGQPPAEPVGRAAVNLIELFLPEEGSFSSSSELISRSFSFFRRPVGTSS